MVEVFDVTAEVEGIPPQKGFPDSSCRKCYGLVLFLIVFKTLAKHVSGSVHCLLSRIVVCIDDNTLEIGKDNLEAHALNFEHKFVEQFF